MGPTVMAPPAFARSAPESFADLAEKLLPAVVNIATTTKITDAGRGDPDLEELFRQFFDRQRRGQGGDQNGDQGDQNGDNGGSGGDQNGDNGGGDSGPREATSLGSGFIIDPSGYIVTNNHVIEGAEEITVRMQDNTEYKAKLIGHDPKTDLALLKIEAPSPLPSVEWGDSDKARIGDWVLAIGNPFGLGGTVTAGILSARQRDINAGPYDDFLQTDAAINRGNSGGPMFDVDGKVIGINTAIFSPSGGSVGIAFAIPADTVKSVVAQLKDKGAVTRGWIGVQIQPVTADIAESLGLKQAEGALVAEPQANSPAQKAGIEAGDIITSVDGKEIKDARDLAGKIGAMAPKASVKLTVLHKGAEKAITLTLGELPNAKEARANADDGSADVGKLGLTLAP